MNSVTLIGRLVRDAETPAGDRGPVKLSLAVPDRVKKGETWEEYTSFVDVVYWHRSCLQYLVKGKQIGVTGKLKQDRWEQDGQARSKIVVDAVTIDLLGGDSQRQSSSQESVYAPRDRSATPAPAQMDFNEDIPF